MQKFSVGIMVYNESRNIRRLLSAVSGQNLFGFELGEVIVVSSGSNDGTDEAVCDFANKDKRVRLIKQNKRYGKSSAINLFFENVDSQDMILLNGDSIPDANSFQMLLLALEDKCSLVGARPVALKVKNNFISSCAVLLWEMHHSVALSRPKIGEMFALRRKIEQPLGKECAVDEAMLEAVCKNRKFKIKYEPAAVVYINATSSVKDFISQRRRIAYGHIWLKRHLKYLVATREKRRILAAVCGKLSLNPKRLFILGGCIALELWGRMLGIWDYHFRKNNSHYIWQIAESTKEGINV